MPTLTKKLLSGSTNGKPIKVAATATTGTLLHTAVSGSSNIDFVDVYADTDDSSTDITLTFEIGGVTDPDNLLKVLVPKRGVDGDGRRLVLRQPMQNGDTLRAFASVANKIKITGEVTTYTP